MKYTAFLILFLGMNLTLKADDKKHAAELKKAVQSINSEIPTSIEFKNTTSGPVKVYWLDFAGTRTFYSTIKANETYTQATFLTHPWLVTDDKENVLGIYYGDSEKRTIEVKPTLRKVASPKPNQKD